VGRRYQAKGSVQRSAGRIAGLAGQVTRSTSARIPEGLGSKSRSGQTRLGFFVFGGGPSVATVVECIDAHKKVVGVEPIRGVLSEPGMPIAPSTHYEAGLRPIMVGSARTLGRSEANLVLSRTTTSCPWHCSNMSASFPKLRSIASGAGPRTTLPSSPAATSVAPCPCVPRTFRRFHGRAVRRRATAVTGQVLVKERCL
jgi:hypothetical protein